MTTRVKKIVAQAKPQELIKEFVYVFSASKPRKLLFDHLPKCGGSSLNEYLEMHYPKRKTFSIAGSKPAASVKEFKRLSQRVRHEYDLIKGHQAYKLIDYVHPEFLKVTVFREPIDRIISHYHYVQRRPAHYLYPKIYESGMSLSDYATSGISGELENYYTRRFSGRSLQDTEKNPEESIAIAFDSIMKRYDIIGVLDNFSSFTEALRHQANLRYEYQNKKVNVTQDRPSINDLEHSTIKKIEQANALDIALYRKIKDTIG